MLNRKERYEQAELKPGPLRVIFLQNCPPKFHAVKGNLDDVGSVPSPMFMGTH